jgi:hypothetical protein
MTNIVFVPGYTFSMITNFVAKWLVFTIVLLCSLGLFVASVTAQTIPQSSLSGYAWSSNIGWISLSCTTGGATGNNICGTSNYQVTINPDRTITGYAWSSNIGWIKFGGLSSFPVGSGTSANNATVSGSYPTLRLEGWARACAGTLPGDCSSMLSRTDGWDGWISLNGTNYEITTSNSGVVSNSYAWGSAVIGWIDMFTSVIWSKPTATLTVADCVVLDGGTMCSANTTWNITGATSPNIYNSTTNSTYSTAVSGTNQPYTLQIGTNTVAGRDGSSVIVTDTAVARCTSGATTLPCIGVPPVVSITTSRIARAGDVVNVVWSVGATNPVVDGSCTLSGPGISATTQSSGNQNSAALKSKSVFGITCTGSYGSVSAQAVVDLIPTAKEV